MNLPFLLKKSKAKKEYFLSLLARPNGLGAILFEEENKNLSLLATAEEKYSHSLEMATSEDLINLADKVISAVETSLPENASVAKTIFVVPYDWIDEGKIKKEHLLRLKKVCGELELTAIGYIISAEAIISYLQKKQGILSSSLFVELAGEKIYIFCVKAGNIVEVKSGYMQGSAVKTVEGLLASIESFEVLPSKMVLFDHEGAGKITREFLAHNWNKDLPFLHTPNVESLEKAFENEAIIHGVANQMGFDVLAEETAQEKMIEEESKNNNFGFLREQDAAEIEEARQLEEAHAQIPHMKHTALDESAAMNRHANNTDATKGDMEKDKEPRQKKNIAGRILLLLPFLKLPKFKLASLKAFRGRKLIIASLILIALLFIGAYLYYATIEKAEVVITTQQKILQKNIPVSFLQDRATNIDNKVIAMQPVSIPVSASDSGPATGKKDTGDKAKGKVTVYNKTDSSKTFTKGTLINGPNNLQFSLVDDATVASTSAFATDISSTDVQVTANNIGQEYNLPSGTNFSFKDFSPTDYFAKNSSAFSGGTKRSVMTVTQKDLDALASTIENSLKAKAASQISSQIGRDTGAFSDPLSADFSEKKFDKKAGQEADKITLNAKVIFKFGTYKKKDALAIAKAASNSGVPGGFSLVENLSRVEVKNSKVNKDGKVDAALASRMVYTVVIAVDTLSRQILGKSDTAVIRKFQQNQDIASVIVVFKNKIPFMPSILPLNASNITVTVKSE